VSQEEARPSGSRDGLCGKPFRNAACGGGQVRGKMHDEVRGMKPGHKYVVDENGKQSAVIVGIEEYRQLLEALEELESIRAYDAAKGSAEKPVPFEKAVEDIEKGRK